MPSQRKSRLIFIILKFLIPIRLFITINAALYASMNLALRNNYIAVP